MLWKSKDRTKRGPAHLSFFWMSVMVLAWLVATCGYASADPSAELPSPTVTPHKKTARLVPSPTPNASPTTPLVLPGNWPSFLLGSGGFNTRETDITSSTASSLTPSWVAHADGGISSEPVVVDWQDSLEHIARFRAWHLHLRLTGDVSG